MDETELQELASTWSTLDFDNKCIACFSTITKLARLQESEWSGNVRYRYKDGKIIIGVLDPSTGARIDVTKFSPADKSYMDIVSEITDAFETVDSLWTTFKKEGKVQGYTTVNARPVINNEQTEEQIDQLAAQSYGQQAQSMQEYIRNSPKVRMWVPNIAGDGGILVNIGGYSVFYPEGEQDVPEPHANEIRRSMIANQKLGKFIKSFDPLQSGMYNPADVANPVNPRGTSELLDRIRNKRGGDLGD